MTNALLLPIIILGLLHLVMVNWMLITRFRALYLAKLAGTMPSSLRRLPDWAVNPANNYNNLTEAPPLFYAVTIAIILAGLADKFYIICAWAFVGTRITHSLVHATINVIPLRAGLFGLSWVFLGVMIVRVAISLC